MALGTDAGQGTNAGRGTDMAAGRKRGCKRGGSGADVAAATDVD